MVPIESKEFYNGQATEEEREECRELARRQTTVQDAVGLGITIGELIERNYDLNIQSNYKARLYRNELG